MPPVKVESTPNPDSLKFSAPGGSFSEDVRSFDSAESARENEIARALFEIAGVEDVLLTPQFVTVTKDASSSWEDLLPDVRPILEGHAN